MLSETVDVREFSSRLTELLTFIAQGNEITLLKDEKPVARLIPPAYEGERVPGLHRGDVWMGEDFDDPLPDSFWTGDE